MQKRTATKMVKEKEEKHQKEENLKIFDFSWKKN
jgi:hypothetical protein